MTAYITVIVLILGLVIFLVTAPNRPADVKEVGRLMFFCGLLVTLFYVGARFMKVL